MQIKLTFVLHIFEFNFLDDYGREVTAYGKFDGGQGVVELEVARGVVAMDVVYFARTGRHQVYLLFHILISHEVNIGDSRIISVRKCDSIGSRSLWIDGIEMGIDIHWPIPFITVVDDVAILIGFLVIKPQQSCCETT